VPVIGGDCATPQWNTVPAFFTQCGSPATQAYGVVKWGAQVVGRGANWGDWYCIESASVCGSLDNDWNNKGYARAAGFHPVIRQQISLAQPDFTADCLAARGKSVRALTVLGDADTVIRAARSCTQQGYNPIYITEGTGFTDQALTTPGLKDNLWSPYPVLPYFSTAPAVTAMNAVLDKYYPGMTKNPNTWSEFAAQAWTAGLLIAHAVKNAGIAAGGTVSPADITKGLDTVSGQTLGGFSPSLTFTAGQPHPVDCWYTGRVQSGKASQVGGLTCKKG